jgi:hypothetical protein
MMMVALEVIIAGVMYGAGGITTAVEAIAGRITAALIAHIAMKDCQLIIMRRVRSERVLKDRLSFPQAGHPQISNQNPHGKPDRVLTMEKENHVK